MTKKFRYDLEFDEDTHWRLVRLGALKKMHQEDFLGELITSVMGALAMDEEEKEDTQANHIPDATKMVPPPVATNEELWEIWDKYDLRAVYNLGVYHGTWPPTHLHND